MKHFAIIFALLFAWTGSALAADQGFLSSMVVPLNQKERRALDLSQKWTGSGPDPYMVGGKLVYVHGGGGIPTIIAAPMRVCDVELQAGESVNEVVLGDSSRWMVEPGSAGNTTHLFIKPVDAGLETSVVITTDRRVYHLRLVSHHSDHMPYVGFTYSGDIQRMAVSQKQTEAKDKEWKSTEIDGQYIDLSNLNFNYEIRGKAAWKPERVYDDSVKTYIRLPGSVRSGEMPVLLVKKGDMDVLVNYRVKGTTMMVDGLFEEIALVVGVDDDQESIEIRRK